MPRKTSKKKCAVEENTRSSKRRRNTSANKKGTTTTAEPSTRRSRSLFPNHEENNNTIHSSVCQCGESNDEFILSSEYVSDVPDDQISDQIVFVNTSSELKLITNDHVQLCIWRQTKLPTFAKILSTQPLEFTSLPSFEGLVTPLDAFERLSSYLCPPYPLRSKKYNALNDEHMKDMIMEISELVKIFSDISKSDFVNVKLEVITDNGCTFWHQDCVDVRLVRTYRGPSTEWVPPANSNETLHQRQHDSMHARSLSHNDIALFKGRGETSEDGELLNQEGIVHRSPRLVEDGGEVCRLVLILDIPVEGWHY